jgi:putative chromate ion transporter
MSADESALGSSKAIEIEMSKDTIKEVKKTSMLLRPWLWISALMDTYDSNVDDDDEKETYKTPKLSYLEIFVLFLWFGFRAYGGPVAQIALMKQELIDEKKWISPKRFNRVYAVYQVLPGPEATELACYFGYIANGRIGALLGGLGFLLPGFSMLLLWSYIYVTFGLDNKFVQKSFRCIQNTIAAFIFRATYKLAEGAILEQPSKKFSWDRFFLCIFCFLTSTIGLNFFISLAVAGCMNTLFELYHKDNKTYWYGHYAAWFSGAFTIGMYVLYVVNNGVPSGTLIGGDASAYSTDSLASLFQLGLIAGAVTFGGAYTCIPFIYSAAVLNGGWLTKRAFLDSVAITNMLPTPLVTFVTMIGFVGHGIGGAIVMTIGIFIPAFSFTLLGHEYFEKLVNFPLIHPFLDGVAASVIGLLISVAFQFIQGIIEIGIDAVVFFLAFTAVFHFTDKYTQPIIIIVAAIAGQTLYSTAVIEQLS